MFSKISQFHKNILKPCDKRAFLQRNNPVLQNGADKVYFGTLQNKALIVQKRHVKC